MHVTLPKRTLILTIALIVAVIVLVLSFLVPGKKESSAVSEMGATPNVPDVRATMEARMLTPMAWTMTDGIQAVTGKATFVGEGQGDYAYITVQSGELEFTFMVSPQTGIFYTADVFAHSNQPSPTVENPWKTLRELQDTPVLVRYNPGDPPEVYSVLIIGGNSR